MSAAYAAAITISRALDLVEEAMGTDGDHHRTWFLDQIAQALAGDDYDALVAEFGDDWDIGIAP